MTPLANVDGTKKYPNSPHVKSPTQIELFPVKSTVNLHNKFMIEHQLWINWMENCKKA